MNFRTLLKRSLIFYRRTHAGVLLGIAVSTAILVGALVIGDSVRYSLKRMAAVRLGEIRLALTGSDRFFRYDLANELAGRLDCPVAAVIQLTGSVSINLPNQPEHPRRQVNLVDILGVDRSFWSLGPEQQVFSLGREEIILNQPLADRLGARSGDAVILRVRNPSLLSREAPLSTVDDDALSLRLTVAAIIGEEQFGHFSLKANQIAPFNAFVSYQRLAELINRPGRVNGILLGSSPGKSLTVQDAAGALRACWQPADADLEVRELTQLNRLELRSHRIFIDEPMLEVLPRLNVESMGILTYLVNEIRYGDKSTPYAMVAALEPAGINSIIPRDMPDDEIVINDWLAEDLQADTGDKIDLTYFVSGPRRKLLEQTSRFRIRAIVPLEETTDPTLMPEFAGISDVDNCRDWEPGIPINLKAIRDKDEDYWDRYRGTPKAYLTLAAGQRIWKNRFGRITAVRFPLTPGLREKIEQLLRQELDPARLGLVFQPAAEQAERASSQALDFGQLFLGLSFFVIVSALLLTGLLFVFGVEQRREEIGILQALGFSHGKVLRLWLGEVMVIALMGCLVGLPVGIGYTWMILQGLASVWRDAVGHSVIHYHVQGASLLYGGLAGLVMSLLTIVFSLYRQMHRTARELLTSNPDEHTGHEIKFGKYNRGLVLGLGAVGGALVLVIIGFLYEGAAVGSFFGAGALLLVGALGFTGALLGHLARRIDSKKLSFSSLAIRNTTRRPGRSLAVVGLLACGLFMIFSVGANRHDTLTHARQPFSGTGGFALMGESSLPIYRDLNLPDTQKEFQLDPCVMRDVKIVPLRIREGDDASCLNLNRVQNPRILGVDPDAFLSRRAFSFTTVSSREATISENPWSILRNELEDNVIPAVADAATIQWALGKKPGEDIIFTNDLGQTVTLRLMGALKNSILQGSLVIAEAPFIKHFASQEGYRRFLIDCSPDKEETLMRHLTDRLSEKGMDLRTAIEQLASINSVQNTYLSIFQILGGLGLLLGSLGLGLVVLRNVLERRNEFAMLQAVGFSRSRIKRLILYEHWFCLLVGILFGVGTAMPAVGPALRGGGGQIPWTSLIFTLVLVTLNGILWIFLATAAALRGELLPALRNE